MGRIGFHLLVILAYVAGLVGVIGFRYFQAQKQPPPFSPVVSSFSLSPPGKALTGTLTKTQGKVEKLSRDDEQYHEASPGAALLYGESVVTHPRSQAVVQLGEIAAITLEANTEISLANLLPENLLLRQKAGTATYTLSDAKNPVSIRALSTLIEIQSGQTVIEINKADVEIKVISGSVRLGAVDSENTTRVTTLAAGEHAVIDGAMNRLVEQ